MKERVFCNMFTWGFLVCPKVDTCNGNFAQFCSR